MKQQTGSKLGKEYSQGYILSLRLFNLYTEYIVQNTRLCESQAGIKIAGRNNNNFRYTDDTSLMAESEKKLMNSLMRVKEESEKASLKLNIQKMKKMESMTAAMKLKDTCSLEVKLWAT